MTEKNSIESQLPPYDGPLSNMLLNAIRLTYLSQGFVGDATKDLHILRDNLSVHSGYTKEQKEMLLNEVVEKENEVLEHIEYARQHPDQMKRSYSV